MNRNLALVFEAKMGKGRLLVNSIDFSNKDKSPVLRQLHYSLMNYLLTAKHWSGVEVSPAMVRDLSGKSSRFVFDAYTKDSPDELKPLKNVKQ